MIKIQRTRGVKPANLLAVSFQSNKNDHSEQVELLPFSVVGARKMLIYSMT